jgi:EmrB/QacA subfamily drug resistance transporter
MMFPIALINVIAAIILVKNVTETSRPKLDVLGVILSTIGFGGLLYAFATGGTKGWTSTEVLAMFIVGGLSILFFIFRQLKIDQPLLEFRIFRYRMFTLTTIINVIVTMAMFSGMILMPIYMQNVRGFSPFLSGLLLLPGGIVMGIMSPITGRLFDKFGARWLAVIGLAITVVTTYELTKLETTTTFMYVMIVYTVRMFGMSLLMMPIFTAGLNELALSLNKYGTAMVNTLRMVAGAVGMAFFVSIMMNQGEKHVKNIVMNQQILPTDKGSMTEAVNQGTAMGINDAFMIATILSVIAFVLAFFIRKTSPKEDTITNRVKKAS